MEHPPTPFSAEVKGRVELYLYSFSVPTWQVYVEPLSFTLPLNNGVCIENKITALENFFLSEVSDYTINFKHISYIKLPVFIDRSGRLIPRLNVLRKLMVVYVRTILTLKYTLGKIHSLNWTIRLDPVITLVLCDTPPIASHILWYQLITHC
jgi:hypothetical protein